MGFYKKVKRIIDFFMSGLLIALLFPVFIFISIFILLFMGTPVFFRQKRIGCNNKEFEMLKFRTMHSVKSAILTDVERITKLGRLLRITRIDELPQLFNIFFGEMSFLGPRPLLPEYLPFYTEEELSRHKVRPGLSGLSQVLFSYPSWEEQFKYDIEYVKGLSLSLDIKIFLKTIKKVLTPSNKLITGVPERERFDVYRKNQSFSDKNAQI
jgi:lipopolysaccharide/colanic/teichoic acid biosynthesis glycosyltransferase